MMDTRQEKHMEEGGIRITPRDESDYNKIDLRKNSKKISSKELNLAKAASIYGGADDRYWFYYAG